MKRLFITILLLAALSKSGAMTQTAGVGHFMIPTAPAAGTSITSGSANAFSASYVQLTASTSAAIFITNVTVQISSTSKPTYMEVQIATGGAGSETIVDQEVLPLFFTSGVTGSQIMGQVTLNPPVPVANATRIAAKTADSVGSLAYLVTLTCINQSNVSAVAGASLSSGNAEDANVIAWRGSAVATEASGDGYPKVNVAKYNDSAVSASSAGIPDVNVVRINNGLTTGNNATLSLAGLSIVSAAGSDAVAITGGAASGATAAGNALKLTGGAASSTSGGVAGSGAKILGGAGAATTNGASAGLTVDAGGTTTVSGNDGAVFTGTGNGNGMTAAKAGSGKDINATLFAVTTATNLTTNNDKTGYSLATDQAVNVTKVNGTSQTARDLGAQLDATVSSRSSHSAADVWAVGTRALTDKAGFSLSSGGIQAIWDALTSALTTSGSIGKRVVDFLTGDAYARLGAPAGASVSADVAAVKSDSAAIKAKTDNLPATPAATGDAMTLTTGERTSVGTSVWASVTRTLSAFGFTVNTNANATETSIKSKTDNLPADPASNTEVDTRMATFTYTAPDNTGIAAIKSKTDNLPADPASNTQVNTRSTYDGSDTSGTTALLARLTAPRATALDNLDATISSRSTYSGADTSGTTTLLGRLTSTRATALDNLDATISSRSTYSGTDTSGTTTLLGRLTAPRSLALDHLDADISSRSTYDGSDTSGTITLLSRLPSSLTITSGKVDVNDKTGFSLTSGERTSIWATQVHSQQAGELLWRIANRGGQ